MSSAFPSPIATSTPRRALVVVALTTFLLLIAASSASATIFRIKPEEMRRSVYVAGDVSRLSRPANCDQAVLEKVLQEMYKLDPSLSKDDAVAAIDELKRAGRGSCRSRASANEAVLAVLKKLNERRPGGIAGKAIVEVTRDALTADLDDRGISVGGSDFGLTASIDSFSTLQAGAFDPGSILGSSFDLAQNNVRFGAARDLLWGSASHMSLFDSTQSLLLGNPELAEIKPFIASRIDPDGSLVYSDAAPRAFIKEQFASVNLASDQARSDTVQVETAKKEGKTKEEIDAIKKQVKEDSDKRKEVLEDAEAGLKFAVFLVEKFDKQTAKDIEAVGKVAIKGAKLFNKLADTAGSITVNIATGNVFGVVKDLMGVAMELAPIFGDMPPSHEDLVEDQLAALSEDIADFRDDVNDRFDRVDRQLKGIADQMVDQYKALDAKLRALDKNVRSIFDTVTALQASLDTVEKRLYQKIDDGAKLDLWSDINTAIGWRDRSPGGAAMSVDRFLQYEGSFWTWATRGATGFALVPEPRSFSPDLLASELSHPGDQNVDYLRRASSALLGQNALSSDTLPNPRDWSVAARAYAALLLENPEYATQGIADRIDKVAGVGQRLREAFGKVSVRDSDTGTRNRVLNAAVGYYRARAQELAGALKGVEDDYIAKAGPGDTALGLDLWGGADQDVPDALLPGGSTMTRCTGGDRPIAALSPTTVRDLLPNPVLVSSKLGIRPASYCWSAAWVNRTETFPGTGGDELEIPTKYQRKSYRAQLQVSVRGRYGADTARTRTLTLPSEEWCFETYDRTTDERVSGNCSSAPPDAAGVVAGRWGSLRAQFEAASSDPVTAAVETARNDAKANLENKQQVLYARIGDSFETGQLRGLGTRLDGAVRLIDGYVTFGLPRAFEQDDDLRALLRGNDRLLDESENRISGDYAAAFATPPATNPRVAIAKTLNDRAQALEQTLARDLPASTATSTGTARSALAEETGPVEPETIPLVETTLARLELTRTLVLAPGAGHPLVDNPGGSNDGGTETIGNQVGPVIGPITPPDFHVPAVGNGPVISLSVARQTLRTALSRGLKLTVAADGPATVTTQLSIDRKSLGRKAPKGRGPIAVGKATTKFTKAGKKQVVVKFGSKGKVLLKKARTATLIVRTSAKGPDGETAPAERKIRLKR